MGKPGLQRAREREPAEAGEPTWNSSRSAGSEDRAEPWPEESPQRCPAGGPPAPKGRGSEKPKAGGHGQGDETLSWPYWEKGESRQCWMRQEPCFYLWCPQGHCPTWQSSATEHSWALESAGAAVVCLLFLLMWLASGQSFGEQSWSCRVGWGQGMVTSPTDSSCPLLF